MVEIVLNSGTTWVVPNDWDDNNNSIQCFAAGASGHGRNFGKSLQADPGGGAGAYARGDNIPLTKGATVQVRIGAGPTGVAAAGSAGGDTCFNATSLANAVSNGPSVSVAAQGGSPGSGTGGGSTGGPGGVGTAGVGNHTRTSGGNGGNGTAGGSSGAGGNCPNGGTGGASVSTNGTNGNPGNAPGGGGSGAKGGGERLGGSGAPGRIVINYTPLDPAPGQHKMFLVFSHVGAWLISVWAGVLNTFKQREHAA